MTKRELAYALGISRKMLKKLATEHVPENSLPAISLWEWGTCKRDRGNWTVELTPRAIRIMAKARRRRDNAKT